MEKYDHFQIDWLLSNELAISPAPQKNYQVQLIKKKGIKSILCLCSEKEFIISNELKKQFKYERFFLPDHKSSLELDAIQIEKALSILNNLVSNYRPVLVHCFAGVERSPIICMAWLIRKHNLTPTQALEYVSSKHKGTCPLPKQFQSLRLLN